MQTDPLSDVLALVRPRFSVASALNAGGEWSIAFPGGSEIRFQAIVAGRCLLQVDGAESPIRLEEGDCIVSIGQPYRMATDLDLRPTPAYAIFSTKEDGMATHNGGGGLVGIGCLFLLEDEHARLLRDFFPAFTHVGTNVGVQTVIRSLLEQMVEEATRPKPGSTLLMQHLSQSLLIQALRLKIAQEPDDAGGWLSALRDERLARAIAAMHQEPGRRWTLQALATSIGMSRTSFAIHFKNVVGVAPMEYLTRWRMLRAADDLSAGHASVSDVAHSAGYSSESAFGVAFKRTMGRPPGKARRGLDTKKKPGIAAPEPAPDETPVGRRHPPAWPAGC